MSADNWEICPKCSREAAWMEDLDREQFRTFREDYKFWGADTGELHVAYKGGCTKCGLSVKYESLKPFYPSKFTDHDQVAA